MTRLIVSYFFPYGILLLFVFPSRFLLFSLLSGIPIYFSRAALLPATIYGNVHGGHVLFLVFSPWILNGVSAKRLEPSDIRRDVITLGFLIG